MGDTEERSPSHGGKDPSALPASHRDDFGYSHLSWDITFVHLFLKHLFRISYVPNVVLNISDVDMNKIRVLG